MAQLFRVTGKALLYRFWKPRLWIVVIGLLIQFILLGAILASLGQPRSPDILLVPAAGNPGACQVLEVRPFSDLWVHNVQPGMLVQILNAQQPGSCQITTQSVELQVISLPARTISANVLSPPVDFLRIASNLLLALIFSVTGIAIFLRSLNRPLARVTYALFYCTSLAFCLFNSSGANYLWVDMFGFVLTMLMRGLAATFTCLFPYSSEKHQEYHKKRLSPYLPLLVGIVLALLSLPMPLLLPSIGFVFTVVCFIYNLICMLIVVGVMSWGLNHLSRQEKQFVRMIVIGIIFLLFPLALNLDVISVDQFIRESLLRLVPVPLAVLPIACNYRLFRERLLGTTSMLSRQVMRILLWILLASVFVFLAIILLHIINVLVPVQEAQDYVYAVLLVVSLMFFPFLWSKVRDAGDQVFYGDFYEYNRSLSELSAALTRLQGIEQISAFMLPRLATLLNATEVALLLQSTRSVNGWPGSDMYQETFPGWSIYRHFVAGSQYLPEDRMTDERLARIASLALTHLDQRSSEPLLLDGVLLLALYDGDSCSGFLCLGPKFSLEPYSKQDSSFLSTLASQLSVLEVNNCYLKQAQADAQQLAALNHRVISTQEEERRHLALELHDEALQQAMLLVRQLSDAGTMPEVAEAMPLARSVVASLRRTCLELRPPLLDELGLEEAFRWLARQTEERCGGRLQIQVRCTGCWETRPAADVELALYRVGQEALSNIFKYAGASLAVIRLQRRLDGTLGLLIADNGCGLQQRQRQVESLGLVGMHERMAAIGGRLQIRTSVGRGVSIRASYLCSGEVRRSRSRKEIVGPRERLTIPQIQKAVSS